MFHVKHEGWVEGGERAGVPLSPVAVERLGVYERLLIERGGPMGLVARNDLTRIRERHILDSLRAAPLLDVATRLGYDLGSGGGLPGVVLAIVRPELELTLVEVRRNRAVFLRSAVEELGLSRVQVYARRAETLRQRRDVCFARAFAPLPEAWVASERLLADEGRLIYWAGRTFDAGRDVPEGLTAVIHRSEGLPRAGELVELRRP